MRRGAKVSFVVLAIGGVVAGGWWRFHHRDRRQDIAEALQRAGYKADDAGRIILTPNDTGLSLAYDPNLRDPTTGFRSSMALIDSCLMTTKNIDDCVRDAPRCLSATPWKDDPAGDSCCPESCFREYFELRKTKSDMVAIQQLGRGTCYPGMKDLATGKWKR